MDRVLHWWREGYSTQQSKKKRPKIDVRRRVWKIRQNGVYHRACIYRTDAYQADAYQTSVYKDLFRSAAYNVTTPREPTLFIGEKIYKLDLKKSGNRLSVLKCVFVMETVQKKSLMNAVSERSSVQMLILNHHKIELFRTSFCNCIFHSIPIT